MGKEIYMMWPIVLERLSWHEKVVSGRESGDQLTMISLVLAGYEALRILKEEIRILTKGRKSGKKAVLLVAYSLGFCSVLSRLSRT